MAQAEIDTTDISPIQGKALTIGAVCKQLEREFPDISISKIRYLEDQKLLTPRRTWASTSPASIPLRPTVSRSGAPSSSASANFAPGPASRSS